MAQGGEGKADSTGDALIIVGVIIGGILAIGYFFGEALTAAWWQWKYAEAKLFSFVMPSGADIHKAIEIMNERFADGDFKKISLEQSLALGDIVGSYMRWPLAALLGWYGWKIWKRSPLHKIKHAYSMQKLVESEVKNWPQIAPVVKLDLVNEPLNEGKWAMGMTPLQMAKKYKLLDDANLLIRKRAERVFSGQLGKMWQSPERLPPHTRALFAAFIAFAANDKKSANDGLSKLSLSWASNAGKLKQLDYSWVAPLLEKHYTDEIKELANKHAYVYTVMATILMHARKKGVLASSDFLWLRPSDRVLWYLLNNVGRNVAWPEVAGIYGHWKAELVAGHPIERPYVQKVVDAMEEAIKNIKF